MPVDTDRASQLPMICSQLRNRKRRRGRSVAPTLQARSAVRQRLEDGVQRRIIGKVVRPGEAAEQNERLAVDDRRIVETRAELGAHVGGILRRISRYSGWSAFNIRIASCRLSIIIKSSKDVREQ